MGNRQGLAIGIGRWVWTPSAVRAEAERVDTEIETLNNDIHSWGDKIVSSQYPEQTEEDFDKALKINEFLTAWDGFYKEWKKYKSDYSSWWGSNVDVIHDYENRVKQWITEFTKRSGLQTTGPEPPSHESPGFLGINWNKIFWAGTIFGGAWLTIELVKIVTQYKTGSPQTRRLAAKK